MNSSDGLVLVIGGNGKIGKSFCLSALKITNYTIINIDPTGDSHIQKNIAKQHTVRREIERDEWTQGKVLGR